MTTLRAARRIEAYARRRDQAHAAHPEIDPRVWALAFKAGYDAGWAAREAEAGTHDDVSSWVPAATEVQGDR